MLDCYEELRSAQRVVPYLSHGTFASLEFWLRGRATSFTGSSAGLPRSTRPKRHNRSLPHLSALDSMVCGNVQRSASTTVVADNNPARRSFLIA
jgi:hypothetical protein